MAINDQNPRLLIRQVSETDLLTLHALENASFVSDRLSKRRLKYWIHAEHRVFLVAENGRQLFGYCLILLHKGTRLARLYSIAVDPAARGRGIGLHLLEAGEREASERGWLFMRLEVAKNNQQAIELYEKMGYVAFGAYSDYYEDHQDALRMQKRIRYLPTRLLSKTTPYHQQQTEFTCGPAALMMAMASLRQGFILDLNTELDIWRQATTIYMTSGHGGCHPLGLALAARDRGFRASVYLNQSGPLFLEGVRSAHKKDIMQTVDRQFRSRAKELGINVLHQEIEQQNIEEHLNRGGGAIILISTYRMDGRKAPHWVTITGMDEHCFYFHDPDAAPQARIEIDCMHIPVARKDFNKMSSFGRQRLRTAVLIDQAPRNKR